MVDVTTEIEINCPLVEVAEYTANPDNAPEWYVNIQSAEWKTAKPLQIGSKIAFVAQFLGKRLAYTYEVQDYIPLQKMIMSTAEGPFPMETTYRWTVTDNDKCHMTLQNKGFPKGFSKLIAPMMAKKMRSANLADLQLLKQILESREV